MSWDGASSRGLETDIFRTRIEELMKRKTRKRLAKEAAMARKEAKGDFRRVPSPPSFYLEPVP